MREAQELWPQAYSTANRPLLVCALPGFAGLHTQLQIACLHTQLQNQRFLHAVLHMDKLVATPTAVWLWVVPRSCLAGMLLATGGEFAFVAFGEAVSKGVLPAALTSELYMVVALSMAMVPYLAALGGKLGVLFERSGGCNEKAV